MSLNGNIHLLIFILLYPHINLLFKLYWDELSFLIKVENLYNFFKFGETEVILLQGVSLLVNLCICELSCMNLSLNYIFLNAFCIKFNKKLLFSYLEPIN